jgi:hypothetical protein
MNHHIRYLRDTQLETSLMYQLAPFIDAYRPHDPIPTKEELGEPIKRTTCNPFTK